MKHKIKKKMNTKESSGSKVTVALFLLVILIIIFLFFKGVSGGSTESNQNQVLGKTNTTTIEGTQYLDVTAKGGYSPTLIKAKAGMDTVLRVTTNSTFDCSSALSIPKLGIRKNLSPSATTEIPIGVQSAGTKLLGTCSMGMYSFNLVFN